MEEEGDEDDDDDADILGISGALPNPAKEAYPALLAADLLALAPLAPPPLRHLSSHALSIASTASLTPSSPLPWSLLSAIRSVRRALGPALACAMSPMLSHASCRSLAWGWGVRARLKGLGYNRPYVASGEQAQSRQIVEIIYKFDFLFKKQPTFRNFSVNLDKIFR